MSTPTRVSLSSVVEINPRMPKGHGLREGDPVGFLAMADISEDGHVLQVQQRSFGDVRKGYTPFQNGDVLLAKITPCFENGKAALIAGIDSAWGFGSTEFHVLRPSAAIDGRYLFHLVWNERFRAVGARNMTGSAGQKRVPASFLESQEIALPSLTEQKRIAAILDKVDGIRRQRREALALTDEFLRAIFLEIFGDPAINPKGMPAKPLSELIKVKSGDFLPAQNMVTSGGIPVYGGNGVSGYHDEAMFAEPKIVIGRVGAYCGAVHRTAAKCWITDNALYVAEQDCRLRDAYLEDALRFANLNQYANQSGQPLISGSRIYPVEILVPPVKSQEKYGHLVSLVKSKRALHQKAEAEANALLEVLSHQLLAS